MIDYLKMVVSMRLLYFKNFILITSSKKIFNDREPIHSYFEHQVLVQL